MEVDLRVVSTLITITLVAAVFVFGPRKVFPRYKVFWFGGDKGTIYKWVFSEDETIQSRVKFGILGWCAVCIGLLWLLL